MNICSKVKQDKSEEVCSRVHNNVKVATTYMPFFNSARRCLSARAPYNTNRIISFQATMNTYLTPEEQMTSQNDRKKMKCNFYVFYLGFIISPSE